MCFLFYTDKIYWWKSRWEVKAYGLSFLIYSKLKTVRVCYFCSISFQISRTNFGRQIFRFPIHLTPSRSILTPSVFECSPRTTVDGEFCTGWPSMQMNRHFASMHIQNSYPMKLSSLPLGSVFIVSLPWQMDGKTMFVIQNWENEDCTDFSHNCIFKNKQCLFKSWGFIQKYDIFQALGL